MSTPSTSGFDGQDVSATKSPIPDALVPLGNIITSITTIGTSIETALNKIPKDAPRKQELTTAVRVAVAGTQSLFSGAAQVSALTKALANGLYRLLQVVLAHLQDRHVYGKRAQLKALFGRPTSPPPPYHLQIQEAFDALKNSLPYPIAPIQAHHTLAAIDTNLRATTIKPSSAPPAAPEPITSKVSVVKVPSRPYEGPAATTQNKNDTSKKEGLWGTTVDAVEGGLRILSSVTDFIPDPAGPIVKLMASTGLTIIKTLKDMKDNREEAMNLGRHIGTLIQTAERFLQTPDGGSAESCDVETAKQLQLFLDALQVLERDLVGLKAQGKLKQGVSHASNKDDLEKWGILIDRAFAALQTQLSLCSIRLLTKMNAVDAFRERDRLIGLLGDGDIGATEKASNPADLMCLPGTRTAVLDLVDQWIADPQGSRIFWISGIAGCGKSAVAATIAGRPRIIPTSTATFYFARGNQERNKRVICSLSQQLAGLGHGSLEHFVLNGVKSNSKIATSHLTTQFDTLIINPLKNLVHGSQPLLLVLDALDEWDDHAAVSALVSHIKQAHKELPPTIRFVLASRNEPHLVRLLESGSMGTLVTRYPLDAVLKSDAGRDIHQYIEKRFAKISAESGANTVGRVWPERGAIDGLVMLSDGLFQWAATVTSYIGAKRSEGRLREIIRNPERYRGLDNLYQGVLDTLSREETNERVPRLLQLVLGSILTASVPIDAITVAHLCCRDMDTLEEVMELIQEEILPSLASMFHVPKDPTQPITVSHKSVLDYLTNEDRCTDVRFYTDISVHHGLMFESCVQVMEFHLKRDICEINDPSKTNSEIRERITQYIPTRLHYSCEHWITHLTGSGRGTSTELCERLKRFSRTHLLHWLEVMSLLELTESVVPVADQVERWLSALSPLPQDDTLTQRLWDDTKRFVTVFCDLILRSAAHIYTSALRLTPHGTEIAQRFSTTVERGVRVTGGLLGKEWSPSPWTAKGHTGLLLCVAFSPNGKTILSGSQYTTMRLWSAETGVQKGAPLKGHGGAVLCAAFSSDGQLILSGSYDKTIRIWDAKSGARKGRPLKGHIGPVSSVSFSVDGKTILSGSHDGTLRLWDMESGVQKGGTFEGHTGRVSCASFSLDGKTILSGSHDGTLRLWHAESGVQKGTPFEGHTGPVSCASFSPDERAILSGSFDKTLRLWDVGSGAQTGEPFKAHSRAVLCASFSPDGKKILSGSHDRTMRLWDVELGSQTCRVLDGHKGPVSCASFSPDGRTILSGSHDRTLRLRDADSLSAVLKAEPLDGHMRGVSCFSFSLDGRTIASGSYDQTVRLWNADMGTLEAKLFSAAGAVSELAFSADGLTLIGRTFDGLSHEWDLSEVVPATSSVSLMPSRQIPREPVFAGSVSPEGWIIYNDTHWFWVPFPDEDWLLCGSRLAIRHERVVYIIDVSEILYIVE